MATLTIRDLDESLKRNLRMRAEPQSLDGRSAANQARARRGTPAPTDLASRIRARFAGLGDVELVVPEREPVRLPPSFDKKASGPSRANRRR
jgi:plasmid stability protein